MAGEFDSRLTVLAPCALDREAARRRGCANSASARTRSLGISLGLIACGAGPPANSRKDALSRSYYGSFGAISEAEKLLGTLSFLHQIQRRAW
jgi:hypothetical protein